MEKRNSALVRENEELANKIAKILLKVERKELRIR